MLAPGSRPGLSLKLGMKICRMAGSHDAHNRQEVMHAQYSSKNCSSQLLRSELFPMPNAGHDTPEAEPHRMESSYETVEAHPSLDSPVSPAELRAG